VAISIWWQSAPGGKASQQSNMSHLLPAFLLFLAFAPSSVVGPSVTSEPGSHRSGWQWPPRAGWLAFSFEPTESTTTVFTMPPTYLTTVFTYPPTVFTYPPTDPGDVKGCNCEPCKTIQGQKYYLMEEDTWKCDTHSCLYRSEEAEVPELCLCDAKIDNTFKPYRYTECHVY